MRRAASAKYALYTGFGVIACIATSCQGNGVTSICPALPLYRSSDLGDSAGAGGADVQTALARAVDAGCVTAPTSFQGDSGASGAASISDSDAGAGGSGAGAAGHD